MSRTKVDKEKFEVTGYKDEHAEVGYTIEEGVPTYYNREALYFKDCQNVGKGIYFSNYFYWMGKIRESAMITLLKDISSDLNTGEIGMVTNSSFLKIVGDATVGDIVERRFGLINIVSDSTVDVFFIWKKMLRDGSYEDIAYGEMRVSWVSIVSHGMVKPRPFPSYYSDFLAKMIIFEEGASYTNQLQGGTFNFSKGANLYSAPNAPRRGQLIAKKIIETTQEDGNSVGNIYFANYSRWQGLVRDAFFHNINREYFKGVGERGELIVTDSEVSHLREIMPFDKVLLTMNVVQVWENAVELTFAYFKIDGDEKVKLAVGSQTVVWAKKSGQNSTHMEALPLPEEFLFALMKNL